MLFAKITYHPPQPQYAHLVTALILLGRFQYLIDCKNCILSAHRYLFQQFRRILYYAISNKQMESSTLFRNRQLNQVSKNVLRLINNKIYPLNQEKMNKIIKHRKKQKITKVKTEPIEAVSFTPTSNHLPKHKATFHQFEERSIGEHFNQFETRQLMRSRIQNRDYELTTEKINNFIWVRRQQISSSLAKKKDGKEVELQKQANSQKKCHLRKNASNISHLLLRLRKKLKEEYHRQSEAFETPIYRFSDVDESERPNLNINFFQQNHGIERVMQRYPVRQQCQVKAREDPNKKFENDLLEEIINTQSNDKYTRMRININHRKIVSLK